MVRYGLAAALVLLPLPLLAQAPERSAQGDVSVTIYNSGRSLISDTRQIALTTGRQRLEFPDVSGRIEPATATLSGAGLGIVEQNFDFDLLTPAKLMEKAVGRTVTILRTNPATGAETREQAKVLAANGGVVLQIGPRIEVLRDDGLPVRVIFDKVPENLRARPTLSVTVESAQAGTRPLSLSYLTGGLGWNADYVALFDRTAGRIDVQGWVTLTNETGTSFDNANLLLVAGEVGNGNGGYRPVRRSSTLRRPGTETANRERLGDFYLYPMPRRTTIANRQTKQVSFLDVSGAPAKAAYEYRNGWLHGEETAESASSVLKFSTSRDQGLGDALPAGTVRVYMKDARGAAQFVGENSIDHTPMGSELSIATGQAFDVKVKPVVEKREKLADDKWRTAMRYTLTNASPEAVTVDVMQTGLDWAWQDTRILSETLKSERLSADGVRWSVPVPANGRTDVSAVFETRY